MDFNALNIKVDPGNALITLEQAAQKLRGTEVQAQMTQAAFSGLNASFKSMAQAIVASDETIQKNPELIRKIVRATLKGMKGIMDDPAAAAADYAKAVPEFKGQEADLTEIFKGYNSYVYPGQKILGEMDEERLSALQNFYLKEGIIEKKTPVKELYTNQFVQ